MPTIRSPRKGSLQYWPRVRAKRLYTRISHYPKLEEAKLNGFAGYKAGMTHLFVADNRPHSKSKGQSIMIPATILECPPLKVASVRFYSKGHVSKEVFASNDKNLGRKLRLPKKDAQAALAEVEKNLSSFSDIRVNVYTQPHKTKIGKKRPEYFEMALGGKTPEEKFNYAKSIVGKEISLKDVFTEGQQVDVFSVTKGKGIQGPVKRFGVSLRRHKSEKGVRGPANVGAWAGNRSWTVAHAGRMGVHNRNDKNKVILKIDSDVKQVNVAGGIINYGNIASDYIILKGSVPGANKRLVRFMSAQRADDKQPNQAPSIESINTRSRQG